MTLQTFWVNPAEVVSAQSASSLVNNSPEILQDLNLVFRARLCLACGHQYNGCRGPRGTATEKVNMAIYEIARLPAMLLMKRCTSTPVEAVFLHPAEVPQYGFVIPRRVDARRFVGR